LVVVSFEPLKSRHFEAQRAFASASLENYLAWNLDYFHTFPRITGTRTAQPYWSNLAAFVSGWAGRPCDAKRPWPLLRESMLEVPYIPMHAKRHVPAVARRAVAALRPLFVERVSAIIETWPAASFVVLGAAVEDRLAEAGLVGRRSLVRLWKSAEIPTTFGRQYGVAVSKARLEVSSRPRVFLRRGPFSQFTNPRAPGREELGRRLRAESNQTDDSDR
jgi:hypothetical protein